MSTLSGKVPGKGLTGPYETVTEVLMSRIV